MGQIGFEFLTHNSYTGIIYNFNIYWHLALDPWHLQLENHLNYLKWLPNVMRLNVPFYSLVTLGDKSTWH